MKKKNKAGRKILLCVLVVLLCFGGLAQAGYIDIYEDTTINSDLDAIVRVHGSAQLTVLSGYVFSVQLLDSSTALVYGGNAGYRAMDYSVLKLYGGDFSSHNPSVGYDGNLAKIYVYGQNFEYQSSSGGDGWLSGNWLDENETEFNIYLRGLPQPFEEVLGTNIFLVPEPTITAFLLIGILGIRKFRG
ncbi:MAG: hypothetical protein NTW93_05310 [Phycisphaerae bacterium]|nr:hypothetical protein [Phycisphaerae bacterium]